VAQLVPGVIRLARVLLQVGVQLCIVSARRKYDQRRRTPRTTVRPAPTPGSLGLIRNDWPIAEPPCGFSPYASASVSTTVDFHDPFSPHQHGQPRG